MEKENKNMSRVVRTSMDTVTQVSIRFAETEERK